MAAGVQSEWRSLASGPAYTEVFHFLRTGRAEGVRAVALMSMRLLQLPDVREGLKAAWGPCQSPMASGATVSRLSPSDAVLISGPPNIMSHLECPPLLKSLGEGQQRDRPRQKPQRPPPC